MSRRTLAIVFFLDFVVIAIALWVFFGDRFTGVNSARVVKLGPINPEIPPIAILSWNIESDGSDPAVIMEQLKELQKSKPFNILALSEVPRDSQKMFGEFFGSNGQSLLGTTGNNDRLVLAWDSSIYEYVDSSELLEVDNFRMGEGGHRAPLSVRLKRKVDGLSFIVMNNHLARGKAEMRNKQASKLVDWARTRSVIAVGDYNMDLDFATLKGNEAFSIMQRDGIFEWKRPKELIDTNWADGNKDGADDYPNSMLDFIFVAGVAKTWNFDVENIVRAGDFPDDEKTSDHRPVLVVVE